MTSSSPRKDDFTIILARMMQGAGVTTQTELASLLEIGKAAISDAKRRNIVPAEWYLKLCRAPYYLNPLWLESGIGEMRIEHTRSSGVSEPQALYGEERHLPSPGDSDAVQVPMALARISPSGGLETSSAPAPCTFCKDWLSALGEPGGMKLLRVTGKAMSPTLEDKDLVLLDETQKDILEGAIYVLRMDSQVVFKRLVKRPGSLLLVSDNRELYDPIEVMLPFQDVGVIGRVVWLCREL